MIGRLFRSVRQKPKAVRDQYAFWIAVVFTGCIAAAWFAQLPQRVTTEVPASVDVVELEQSEGIGGLLNGFGDQVSTLREEIANITATTSVESTSSTTTSVESAPVEDLQTLVASSTVSTTASQPPTAGRAVRIATTTASTTQ